MRIGGHPPAVVVERVDGVIRKSGTDIKALHNEAQMLEYMSTSGYTPKLLAVQPDHIVQEDLGVSEPVYSEDTFRRHCICLLQALRERGIRHNDLTSANIIVRSDKPYLVDFQESYLVWEEPIAKQEYNDSYTLWSMLAGMADGRRIARRWLAILTSLGGHEGDKRVLGGMRLQDLGCWEGDFVMAARCEDMHAIGLDIDQEAIMRAHALWGNRGFFDGDIEAAVPYLQADVTLMLSTWAYLDQEYANAEDILARVIKASKVTFFETQLAGDGPGPKYLRTDEDVESMLSHMGSSVQPLLTIALPERMAHRTLWRVDR